MAVEWLVVELSEKAEDEAPDLVQRSIKHYVKNAVVFVPVSVSQVAGESVIKYLFGGYVFIRRDTTDDKYLKLEGTKYVEKFLSTRTKKDGRTVKVLSVVDQAAIDKMMRQIKEQEDQGIVEGDIVTILSGPYSNCQAKVICEIPEDNTVQVHIDFLRTKEAIVSFPRACLKLYRKGTEDDDL